MSKPIVIFHSARRCGKRAAYESAMSAYKRRAKKGLPARIDDPTETDIEDYAKIREQYIKELRERTPQDFEREYMQLPAPEQEPYLEDKDGNRAPLNPNTTYPTPRKR